MVMSTILKVKKLLFDKEYRFSWCDAKGLLRFLDDKTFLKRKFRIQMGYDLNLDDPQTFNEKLQWLKLHDRRPEYTRMVDKYEAKQYVAEQVGEECIIPTLGVWDRFEDIDFDSLPQQFVLKCTHDSGGLVICRDKTKLDINAAKKKINKSLKTNYYYHGREWPYKNVKRRIIAEQYMEDAKTAELRDYKFYCFHGEAKFLYVSEGLEDHTTAKISFLNMDWTFAPFQRNDFRQFDKLPEKPQNFEKMQELACELSGNIPFVRVDLYEINGQLYFSELTFSPCSGMMPFEPEEWDLTLGNWIELPEKTQ